MTSFVRNVVSHLMITMTTKNVGLRDKMTPEQKEAIDAYKKSLIRTIDEMIEQMEIVGHNHPYDEGYFQCANNIKDVIEG